LKVLPPFIVYEQDDTYTEQMRNQFDV
jgi:tRNA1(Val) A37 N6-methylase TrmN6